MISKNNFIELEFIGKVKGGEIFDTNIQEEAKKIDINIELRPLVICIGQNMILPALDEFLLGKELGKYSIELEPEKAFGSRNSSLIKTVPAKIFAEQNLAPKPGMMLNFDNLTGKIIAVSGGRVIVDFNNPLAGKVVIYELNAKRIVTEEKEEIESLMLFFFRRKFSFRVENSKLIITTEKQVHEFLSSYKDKFKEILGLELELEEEKKQAEKPAEKVEEKDEAKAEVKNIEETKEKEADK